jgi:hypothetical protein
MKPVSLADITYEQGLKLLALRKQAMDQGRIRRMTPEALANTLMLRDIGHSYAEKMAEGGWLDSLKSGIGQLGQQAKTGLGQAKSYFETLDPASRNTLLAGLAGTGLGAAAGLGQAAMSDDDDDDNYLTSALRGGVAGGALGGGLGLALNPGVADKLYSQGKALFGKAQQQAKPPAGQAPATAITGKEPPSFEELQRLSGKANSYMPEAVLGAGLAGTAAGTGYGIARSLNRKTYDPAALAKELVYSADAALKDPARVKAYSKMLSGGNNPNALQDIVDASNNMTKYHPVTGKNYNPGLEAITDNVQRQLSQQGHTSSWLQTLFGRSSNPAFRSGKDTLEDAARALGQNQDDALKLIARSGIRGRNPRAIIPSLIAALGTSAAGALLGNYQNDRADRAQAQQEYGNLADTYLNNQ